MKVLFSLKESIYDCKIQITDTAGSRYYLIPAVADGQTTTTCITVDIYGNEFDLTLTPLTPDTTAMFDEFEENTWKDKFTKKATKLLFSSLGKMILRVGCRYHINGIEDGDRLDISLQSYIFGAFDYLDILELVPMVYAFFEISHFNDRFIIADAFETNRKDVLKFAKTFAFSEVLGNGILATLFTYPLQVARAKHLSKNRKIRKTLIKFSSLSELEREKFLKKQEKFLDW